MVSRRQFLASVAGGAAVATLSRCVPGAAPSGLPDAAFHVAPDAGTNTVWRNRGVVVTTSDLTLDWAEAAAHAGLNTVALHVGSSPNATLVPFIRSTSGKAFLRRCEQLGVAVEYEIHAMSDLLPRSLFQSDPTLFRLDKNCVRNPDANLCVHTPAALEICARNAVAMAQILRPTTGRYYYWSDDATLWCECTCCLPLGQADQALVLENYLIDALRKDDSTAQLCHLAYGGTFDAPTTVEPRPNIFLEFAAYYRRYDIPLDTPTDPLQKHTLDALDANLRWFGTYGAQALEYWMDDSVVSAYRKPQTKLPWNPDLVRADVAAYHARGVLNITSFAVYLDAAYVQLYGNPPTDEYGAILAQP